MPVAKGAVARESDLDCPMTDARMDAQLRACLRESRQFSKAVLEFLGGRGEEQKALWARRSVDAGRVLFQPWVMEVLFVLAVGGRLRFSQLQERLNGISSRTLSDKLQTLRAEGLVDRRVLDEQPVRIDYSLTRAGLATAALATPLFAHLNAARPQG